MGKNVEFLKEYFEEIRGVIKEAREGETMDRLEKMMGDIITPSAERSRRHVWMKKQE